MYFKYFIAPGGSILEEGEKATWRTSVCVFEANEEDLKTYVQVCCTSQVLNDSSYLHNIIILCCAVIQICAK